MIFIYPDDVKAFLKSLLQRTQGFGDRQAGGADGGKEPAQQSHEHRKAQALHKEVGSDPKGKGKIGEGLKVKG